VCLMKRLLFRFKYPKIAIYLLMILIAYIIFSNPSVEQYLANVGNLSYLGVFIAGVLFSFGFTTPYAVGIFLFIEPSNIMLAAFIGGFGALLSDLLIFETIKLSFMDEFHKLEKEWPLAAARRILRRELSLNFQKFLVFTLSAIVFASPLPDELAVALLVGLSKLSSKLFMLVSYLSNTIGILIMLSL
jgi:hypothetical protein